MTGEKICPKITEGGQNIFRELFETIFLIFRAQLYQKLHVSSQKVYYLQYKRKTDEILFEIYLH